MTAEGFDPNAGVTPAVEAKPVSSEVPADAGVDQEATPAADDDPADASDPIEPKPDAETERRLSAVQRAEKRSREMLTKERAEAKAEIERERAELSKWKAERDSFEQMKARAKYDPAGVLAALGLTDEDLEPAARDLYARSKGAQSDPKAREAALKMQREREVSDRVAKIERENAELREQFTQRDQEAAHREAFDSFVGDVKKVANGTTPLFEKAPARANQLVRQVLQEHWAEHQEIPDVADVIASLEKRLPDLLTVAEHRRIFGDVTPAKPVAVVTPKPPTTLGADMTGATPVPKIQTQSLAERRAETTRLMEQGKLTD